MSSITFGGIVGGGAGGGGNVDSVSNTSVINALTTWADVNGREIKDATTITAVDETLKLKAANATSVSNVKFANFNDTDIVEIRTEHDAARFIIAVNTYDLDILTSSSNFKLITTDSAGSITVRNSLSPDTVPNLILEQAGTQGSNSGFHVGMRLPEGVISAIKGMMHIDQVLGLLAMKTTGVTATLTGWRYFTLATDSTTVDNRLCTWNGTNAAKIQDDTQLTAQGDGLAFTASTATTTSTLSFKDNANAEQGHLSLSHSASAGANELKLESLDGQVVIEAINGSIDLLTTSVGSHLIISNIFSGDTVPVMTLNNGGANGGTVAKHVGNRPPNGNVIGSPGDVYHQHDTSGNIGDIHLKTSGIATNTGWESIRNHSTITAAMGRDTISLPLAQIIGPVTTKCNAFVAAEDLEGVTGSLLPDGASNQFDIKEVIDSVNGDLYGIVGSIGVAAPAGLDLVMDISFDDGVTPTTTKIVTAMTGEGPTHILTVPISGRFRGPTVLGGAGTGHIQLNSATTIPATTITWHSIDLSAQRLPFNF